MTFATNFTTAVLSAALAQQMIGGPWWAHACVAILTGFVVMATLTCLNPRP